MTRQLFTIVILVGLNLINYFSYNHENATISTIIDVLYVSVLIDLALFTKKALGINLIKPISLLILNVLFQLTSRYTNLIELAILGIFLLFLGNLWLGIKLIKSMKWVGYSLILGIVSVLLLTSIGEYHQYSAPLTMAAFIESIPPLLIARGYWIYEVNKK